MQKVAAKLVLAQVLADRERYETKADRQIKQLAQTQRSVAALTQVIQALEEPEA